MQDTNPGKKLTKKPKYIFELKYSEEAESKFVSTTGDYEIMYAFHGSSVENFHSIINNGLLNIFNKVRMGSWHTVNKGHVGTSCMVH